MLDTNVLASGSVASSGTMARIVDAWRDGAFEFICSEPAFDELTRTLNKPYFADRLSPQGIYSYLTLIRATATFVLPDRIPHGVAPHPEDDLILATALSSAAQYLVTGDRAFRAIDTYEDTTIITPVEFLAIINAYQS